MTTMEHSEELTRIAELIPFFEARRLGYCPYCGCTTAWINSSEFGRHMLACVRIMQGQERAVQELEALVST